MAHRHTSRPHRHRRMRAAAVLAAMAAASCLAAPAAKRPDPPHRIGFRILRVPQPGGQPLVVALWYPTQAGPGRTTYSLPTMDMASDATRDATPAKGPFPLVIYSHGGGGCAIMGAAHAEALTEHGFVVAGPDHHDEFTAARSDRPAARDPARVWEWLAWARGKSAAIHRGTPSIKYAHRPAEVRATIDHLLKASADPASPLHQLVDPARIGMMGVSFGAWTTQAVAGYIPTCRDARIKAAVPIAGGPGRRVGSFANVTIPLMLVFGEEETLVLLDRRSPRKAEGMIRDFESANPPKLLVGIKGARHLDFGGAGVGNRRLRAATSSAAVRTTDPVLGTVNRYCITFFRRYLLGDQAAEAALTRPEPHAFLLRAKLHPD